MIDTPRRAMSAAPAQSLPDPAAYGARVLAEAEQAAAARTRDPDEAVHEARVAIKRLRALWALIQPLVGRPLADRQNDALREAARALTGRREARVTLDTLALVASRSRSKAVQAACARAQQALGPAPAQRLDDALLDRALTVLRDSAALLALLPWQGWGWAAIEPGLRRAYRQGRRRLRGCGAGRDDEAFHDWRKVAKRLQYQLELSAQASDAADAAHRQVRELGRALGDAHDLAMLRQKLLAGDSRLPPAEQRALGGALERMLRRLYQGALLSGMAFYHLAPASWSKALHGPARANPGRDRPMNPAPRTRGLARRGQSG